MATSKYDNYDDYGSEFEHDTHKKKRKQEKSDLLPTKKRKTSKVASKEELIKEYSKDEGIKQKIHYLSLDAYSRHKKIINDYMMYYGGRSNEFVRDTSRDKTDMDILHENHRFLWSQEDKSDESWEKRMAKKYYDKLYKEYSVADLRYYRQGKIAMRWRIDKEVIEGKGQFICGEKNCRETQCLRTWEVNFSYVEQGEKKNALVKLRLCPDCSDKLNYKKRHTEIKKSVKIQKNSVTQEAESTSTAETITDNHNEHTCVSGTVIKSKEKVKEAEHQQESVWREPIKVEEKSRDDEFQDYFEDMFL